MFTIKGQYSNATVGTDFSATSKDNTTKCLKRYLDWKAISAPPNLLSDALAHAGQPDAGLRRTFKPSFLPGRRAH